MRELKRIRREATSEGAGMGAVADKAAGAETVLLARRLDPHRSLTRAGRRKVLVFFAVAQALPALACALAGGWPASVFAALTWGGLAFALARNARVALAYEELEISALELRYVRVSVAGLRRTWRFNPLWVRLAVARHQEFGVERLDLLARRRRLEIGAFLGRGEKTRLAEELGAALAQARRGTDFGP
jgi:uncharacterized membrane protein